MERRDARGLTALMKAAVQGQRDCVTALLLAGERRGSSAEVFVPWGAQRWGGGSGLADVVGGRRDTNPTWSVILRTGATQPVL